MVGDLVGPDPVHGHAQQVLRLVLVELSGFHHPQAISTRVRPRLQVIEDAQRGVDLPDVIGVQAGQLSDRRGSQ
ncbi:hypothetical protein D3C72_2422410 [compost metagenome]